jgi:hypothetical protein
VAVDLVVCIRMVECMKRVARRGSLGQGYWSDISRQRSKRVTPVTLTNTRLPVGLDRASRGGLSRRSLTNKRLISFYHVTD